MKVLTAERRRGLAGSVDGVIVAAPLGGAGSGGGVQAVRAVLSPRSLLEIFRAIKMQPRSRQESRGVYRSVRGVHSALCVRVEALVRAGGAAIIAAALRLALRLGERVAAVGPRRRVDFARRRRRRPWRRRRPRGRGARRRRGGRARARAGAGSLLVEGGGGSGGARLGLDAALIRAALDAEVCRRKNWSAKSAATKEGAGHAQPFSPQ